jgi:hypothetical protein
MLIGSIVIAACLVSRGAAVAADPDPPLRTDIRSYFVFAMSHSHLKNFRLQGACNVAVNCAQPAASSECGVVSMENPVFNDGSQIAGDVTRFSKPGGTIWQLFRNDTGSLANVTIRHPGIKPDGSNPLAVPILGDLDGDGTPSCQVVGGQCVPDYGDVAAWCGFPAMFPACDASRLVTAVLGDDCAYDVAPGNGQCDLAPGTYGELALKNDATVQLAGEGQYAFCRITGGRRVKLLARGARVYVPNAGHVHISNASTVGQECGDIRLLAQGRASIIFGRGTNVAAKVCAPEATIKLGHGNRHVGQFIADVVDSDDNGSGECCPGRCACFDTFTPQNAAAGATVVLQSGCDLSETTAVRICGAPATILTPGVHRVEVRVPSVSGSCRIEVDSPAGTFVHVDRLTVS